MPKSDQEVLVIRGRLDRAGRFVARRCGSTYRVREWPVVERSEYLVELLDVSERVLHRELAQVTAELTCDPGDARRFRVLAYIGLRPEARRVRLRHDDLIMWEANIPEPPKVRATLGTKRPTRKAALALNLRYSEPGEDAHLSVVYQWGERQHRPIYIGPPAESIRVDVRALPGGDKCRFVVAYSNGLRTAGAATRAFRLPRFGPMVSIAQPGRDGVVVEGTALVLEGNVADPERPGGPRLPEDLVWLVDGEPAAAGAIASLDALPVGRHTITLVYRARPGAERTVVVRVAEAGAVRAQQWPQWEPTDDRFG
jgi:hypothetical protein